MDIRQWLENTADREPPDERVETGFPAFLQPEPGAIQPRRKARQKRKRASSGPGVDARQPSAQSYSSEGARLGGNGAVARTSSSSDSSSAPSRESIVSDRREAPIETFQRRARHKTKPDRYESKPKRRKKEHGSGREKKPNSRRRKSHRNGDGARTTGLVQSFHLKNGPKNQRLTLKPDASAGIFKNGRASGPVETSGPGLPDLVFNEMRFLRRPKEHQDEQPVNASKKPNKKSQKQMQEEEISAYFNKNLAPDKQNGVIKSGALRSQSARKRPLEPILGPPPHPVELPEKAFLGFGSRGPPQESIERQLSSNSYCTWSESLPAKQSPVTGRPTLPAFSRAAEREDPRRSVVSNTLPPSIAESPKTRQSQSPAMGGRGLRSRRAGTKALGEVHQAVKHTSRGTIAAVDESSESLPKTIPMYDDAQVHQKDSSWHAGSLHTSDILQIRNSTRVARISPSTGPQERECSVTLDKEYPATSTPTSEGLRRAFGAVTKQDARIDGHTQSMASHHSREQHEQALSNPTSLQRIRPAEHPKVPSSPPRWEIPRRGFSRTVDSTRSQQRPSSRLTRAMEAQSTQRPQPRSREASRPFSRPGNEEMLDVLPDAPLIRPQLLYDNFSTRNTEFLACGSVHGHEYGASHQLGPDFVEPAMDQDDYPVAASQFDTLEALEPTGFAQDSHSFPSEQMEKEQLREALESRRYSGEPFQRRSDMDSSHREVANPGLASFWRPNMLY